MWTESNAYALDPLIVIRTLEQAPTDHIGKARLGFICKGLVPEIDSHLDVLGAYADYREKPSPNIAGGLACYYVSNVCAITQIQYLPRFTPFLVKNTFFRRLSSPQPITSPVCYVSPYTVPSPDSEKSLPSSLWYPQDLVPHPGMPITGEMSSQTPMPRILARLISALYLTSNSQTGEHIPFLDTADYRYLEVEGW
jgi:hypothetical protein